MSYADTDPRFVYQFLDAAGEHIYIGCTADISERIRRHRKGADWFGEVSSIVIDVHPGRAEGEAAEAQLIRDIQPRANIVGTLRQSETAMSGWRRRKSPEPVDMPDSDRLTTAQVAAVLGTSVRTVHRMVASGALAPMVKLDGIRGAYLFDADEVRNVKRPHAA